MKRRNYFRRHPFVHEPLPLRLAFRLVERLKRPMAASAIMNNGNGVAVAAIGNRSGWWFSRLIIDGQWHGPWRRMKSAE